jgi:hypothetical protein
MSANVIKIDRAGIECLFVPKSDWDKLVGLIRTINRLHSLADAVYDVREREGEGWGGKNVSEYGLAHQELGKLMGGWE